MPRALPACSENITAEPFGAARSPPPSPHFACKPRILLVYEIAGKAANSGSIRWLTANRLRLGPRRTRQSCNQASPQSLHHEFVAVRLGLAKHP